MFLDGFLMWNIIGQGFLALFLGENRFNNAIYKIITAISSPLYVVVGAILPGRQSPFTLGMVSIFLLLVVRFVVYIYFFKMGWIPSIAEPAN